MKTILRLLALLRPFWGEVLLSVLLGAATLVAGIGLLGTSADLIARAALRPSIAELQVAIVGVRFFGLSRAVFRYLERLVSHSVNFRLLARLRTWFYQRLEPLAPARLWQVTSGDLLARSIADIETLENFYVRVVAPPLTALVIILGVSLFAGSRAPLLGWALAAGLLITGFGVPLLVQSLARRPGAEVIRARSQLNSDLVEGLQGMEDLLVYGQAASWATRIEFQGSQLNKAQRSQAGVGAMAGALGLFFSLLTLWIMLVLAIPRVDGVALAVLSLVTLASFEAVTSLPAAANHLESSLQAARRVFELVDAEPAVQEPAQPAELGKQPDLSIHKLTFSYKPDSKPALQELDLDLSSGRKVALVGPSGAGKSTLVNLLARFWPAEPGSIRLDGRQIEDFSSDAVRARLGVVGQNTYLFTGSLRDNLLLANPHASEEDICRVLETAQLSEWVDSLPQGLDTPVGERGTRISAGERQRLAVARVLLQDAPIVVLDEPTANLDALTEQRVMRGLWQELAGRTVLLVTHRLVQMEALDEILMLSEGRVIERGTHADLIQAGGLYACWWKIQNDALLPE